MLTLDQVINSKGESRSERKLLVVTKVAAALSDKARDPESPTPAPAPEFVVDSQLLIILPNDAQ